MGDFRPIYLLNGSIKIISKILINRSMALLNDLLDIHKTGFSKAALVVGDSLWKVWQLPRGHAGQPPYLTFLLNLDFGRAYYGFK